MGSSGHVSGAVFTIVVAACVMIAGSAAKMHGVSFSDPAQMASDLHFVTGGKIRSAILLLMIIIMPQY